MSYDRYQLIGLTGFTFSGVFFLIAGIRAEDTLTVVGSAAWMIACGVWAVPVLRPDRRDDVD